MKTTIFVAITIAALGALGVTTSIMSSGIPAYAMQASCMPSCSDASGHVVVSDPTLGTFSSSGHNTLNCSGPPGSTTCSDTKSGTLGGTTGGKLTENFGDGIPFTYTKCVGSPSFKSVCGG